MDAFTPALLSVLSLRLDIPVFAEGDPAIAGADLCAVLDLPRLGELTLSLMSRAGIAGLGGPAAAAIAEIERIPLPVNERMRLSPLALAQIRHLSESADEDERIELTFHYDLETNDAAPELTETA